MCYHEHDSLLDHKEEEELSEEERKAAWAEYEAEKKVGRGKPRARSQRHTDTPGAMGELDEPVGPASGFSGSAAASGVRIGPRRAGDSSPAALHS